jgi:hypothetical protein
MGIFEKFREKVMGKREVVPPEEIREAVLGPPVPPPPAPALYAEKPPELAPAYTPPYSPYAPEFERPELPPPELVSRETIKKEEERSLAFEIRDRLSIIEAQLTAIRSQTETINERLKSLELKLGIAARRGYY